MIAMDYKLKSDIYLKLPGQEELVYAAIQEGVKADTVLENKVTVLKDAAEAFRKRAASLPAGNDSLKAFLRAKEGDILSTLLVVKPNPTINEMFDAGRAYYFGQQYAPIKRCVPEIPGEIPCRALWFRMGAQ